MIFFKGLFATALDDGEIITQVAFPISGQGGVFQVSPIPPLALR